MTGRRVVLLARAGGASERAEAALHEAGAQLVGTFDPASASLEDVRATSPEAVLVLLDAAVEQALGPFETWLSDGALDVIYDDAEVALRREGWDTARWSRHLRAKLHGHDDVLPPAIDAAAPQADSDADFAAEMDALQRQMEAMPELPHHVAGSPVHGAVVIAAGTGGPDAVRQLLAGLPASFPRPILLRQRIEGGQYDRLVRQMDRATDLPVLLARTGDMPLPGHVHVMPPGLGLHETQNGLRFVEDSNSSLGALSQADSAILLLSGADPELVDVALAMRWAGGLGLGQSRDNCFDPAASDALVARGGEAMGLAGLSRQLLDRWPA